MRTIEAHTADLEAALDHLRGSLDVDSDNVVVLAWSYGGQTAARLQELDDGVRGVIGLDANVLPARPEESLDLRRPLVFLIGRETGGRGFAQLESLTAPWISLRFPDLAHGGFNAMEGYLPEVLGGRYRLLLVPDGPGCPRRVPCPGPGVRPGCARIGSGRRGGACRPGLGVAGCRRGSRRGRVGGAAGSSLSRRHAAPTRAGGVRRHPVRILLAYTPSDGTPLANI